MAAKKDDAAKATGRARNHMLTNVVLLGARGAQDAILAHPKWAVLGLRDKGNEPVRARTAAPRLNLNFDDVQHVSPAILRHGYVPCTEGDAKKILEFAKLLYEQPAEGLIVHCEHGVGRSSAALIGVLRLIYGPRHEVPAIQGMQRAVDRAVQEGWRDHVRVSPNMRLIALFDRELHCDGVLVAEVLEQYNRYSPMTVESVFRSL